jgi:hypothetical protein
MPARLPGLLLVAFLALLVAAAAASPSPVVVARLAPVEDASLPFGCDWSYDWEARCTRDDSDRLPIGGDGDNAWRAALRFSVASLPAGAHVQQALLTLYHDATCLGPSRTNRPCDSRPYTVEAHAILDPDWVHEREVAYDPTPVASTTLPDASAARPLVFDVSDLVAAWLAGDTPAAGILLQLADGEEWLSVGGPKPPSSTAAIVERRPRLDVTYVAP